MRPPLLLSLLFSFVLCWEIAKAETDNTPFLPTWKLLNSEQKQQFISGYLSAIRDTGEILYITEKYLTENPSKSVAVIKELQSIYRVDAPSPLKLSREIDVFYALTENRTKPLSLAVSSARSKLRNKGN